MVVAMTKFLVIPQHVDSIVLELLITRIYYFIQVTHKTDKTVHVLV